MGDARFDTGVDCAAPPVLQTVTPPSAEMDTILATIKTMESGGDYTVAVTTSTASGAYGFLDSSWGGYGGFRRAKDAPPEVQDAKAAELVAYILQRNGGDISTIPVSWYIGHVPVGSEWDTVPAYPGNRLTPREYQQRWMQRYAQLQQVPASPATAKPSWTPSDTSNTCQTVVVMAGTPRTPNTSSAKPNPSSPNHEGAPYPTRSTSVIRRAPPHGTLQHRTRPNCRLDPAEQRPRTNRLRWRLLAAATSLTRPVRC